MAVDAPALLESLLRYAYPLIFLAGLAEAVPLLGILIPGQAIIIAAGALAATGRLDLRLVILAALPAGILGDAIGYYIGRRYGRPFLEKYGHRLRISEQALARGDRMFARFGPFALVLGRFSFLTRGIVALMAGITRMRQRVFWPVNVAGGIAWAVGFVLTGYLGASAYLYLEGRLGVVLAVTLLAAAGIYLLYRVLRRNAPQFTREDLALALVAVAAGTLFGVLADRVVALGEANAIDAWQDAYVAAFAPLAPLLSVIAAATSLFAMGAVALLLLGFLAYKRLAWEAGLVGLGVGGVILLVALLRPLLRAPDGHEGFPSAHAAVTTVMAGIVAHLVASHARRPAVALGTVAGCAVAATLAAHALLGGEERPTDAVGGIALGATWLALSLLLVEFGVKRESRPPR